MIFFENMRMGNTSIMGVTIVEGGINIAVPVEQNVVHEFGIVFYQNRKEVMRLAFLPQYRVGNVYAVRLDGQVPQDLTYLFYCDGQLLMDAYARKIRGREKWGDISREENLISADFLRPENPQGWDKDTQLCTPYEDSIFYSLHVRGFTKHTSSKVAHKGTFDGLAEKIPYLKELQITAVVAMPIYEFNEIITNPAYHEIDPKLSVYLPEGNEVWQHRMNYWGFSETDNYYFAPKAAYAVNDPVSELKELVLKLHQSGIELLLQMYFSPKLSPDYIRDVLRFWVLEYHIDGFQLMGAKIPMELLGKDPLLGRTKLIAENTFSHEIYGDAKNAFLPKHLARYQDGFRNEARRFLKGDSDLVYAMAENMRRSDEKEGVINHITDYRGFTLLDLVSYDRKHNEENGEENRDGSDYNYSWNCGVEGPSKKKAVNLLRLSQRKNALAMLFLAQGTPLLLSGDESGHTTLGNNNAYCQDNKTNYLNWNRNKLEEELFEFCKALILFRKNHKILHLQKPIRLMDTLSCGYPDLSYHGEQAWQPGFENYNHHFAMLYCNYYEGKDVTLLPRRMRGGEFVYLAFNMHWISHTFSLPLLPNGFQWEIAICSKDDVALEVLPEQKLANVCLPARSMVLISGKNRSKEK